MNEFIELPPEQEAIRRRCIHPSKSFVEFPSTEVEGSLSQRFERQAELHPERVAVKTPRAQMTYRQLNESANRIARALPKARSGGQAAVALLLGSDALPIAAMLGVLKSANFFVMLDPLFPLDRIAYMLEDSGADLIITSTQYLPLAKELSGGKCQIFNAEAIEAEAPADNLQLVIDPDQMAYIIYTSGSTGQPKGIVFNHRSVLFGISNYTNAFHICMHDRLTLLHSPGFSSGIVDIFCALLNGAAVYPWNLKRDGMADLGQWLAEEQLTIFDWVPTPFRYFVKTISGHDLFPHLRLLILASEPVYAADLQLYKSYFSANCIFVNRLGATETYNFRLFFADRESQIDGGLVPAGYAVPGKRVLLLDGARQEVGAGQVGEIAIQSRYLAVGYWRRPDLTQAAFLPDPAGGDVRIYQTGDLGMLRADGCLEYRGRKDSQVKVRGYRIEISEIETALNELESIREAAVVSRETGTSEKQLIAYFVPAVKPAPAISEVREALLRRLPDYMIPAIFVQMQSLPVTPTGKVDRNALASATVPRTNEAAISSAPRDEIEYKLLSMWAQVLDVEAVGVADNFFELGGHSLSSMRLLVEIERQFGQRLPQSILLQFPTVEALARVIREKREVKEDAFTSVLPINRNGSRIPMFCMPGIMGNVFSDLGGLSRAMGADQPFYGLQDGMGVPAGVEAKAGRFLREIRSVQPHGPYLLCGVCSGALTVSAIARRLQEQGEQVALLAFIEPAFPWRPGPRSWRDFANNVYIRLTKRLDLHTVRVLRLSMLDQGRYLLLKLKLLSNMWGSRQYGPRIFKGTIHIFATRPSLAKVPHNFQLPWDQFAANGVRLHEVPGTHNAITGDYDTPIEETVMQMIGQGLREVIDGSASPASDQETSMQTPPWNAATTAAHSD